MKTSLCSNEPELLGCPCEAAYATPPVARADTETLPAAVAAWQAWLWRTLTAAHPLPILVPRGVGRARAKRGAMGTPDLQQGANAGILRFLAAKGGRPLDGPPDSVPSPYVSLGTHPDAVGWLWDTLNARLPADCRWIVRGTVALVHPITGILFACGGGTDYLLRLPPPLVAEALRQGATQVKTYGVRTPRVLDLRDYDPCWIFGRWRREEADWCLAAYRAMGAMQDGAAEAR